MRPMILAGLACAVALSGCAPQPIRGRHATVVSAENVPNPVPFSESHQRLVASANHWRQIADDVANRMMSAVRHDAVKIEAHSGYTPFELAFPEMLSASFAKLGVTVYALDTQTPADMVGFDIQVVNHNRSPEPAPNVEIVVDVSVRHGDASVRRDSRVYYVAPGDVTNYVNQPVPALTTVTEHPMQERFFPAAR